jgi:hypothetical protein
VSGQGNIQELDPDLRTKNWMFWYALQFPSLRVGRECFELWNTDFSIFVRALLVVCEGYAYIMRIRSLYFEYSFIQKTATNFTSITLCNRSSNKYSRLYS